MKRSSNEGWEKLQTILASWNLVGDMNIEQAREKILKDSGPIFTLDCKRVA